MKAFAAVCLIGVMSAAVVVAQDVSRVNVAEAPIATAPPKTPSVDELVKAWIDNVVLAAQAEQDALETVKETDAYKKYEARKKLREQLQAQNTTKVEAKYAGYTMDWTKRVLVPKPAQTAKK